MWRFRVPTSGASMTVRISSSGIPSSRNRRITCAVGICAVV